MGKVVGLVVVAVIAFAYFHSGGSRKPAQPVQAADPLADMQARLKAEQERLRAEEDERSRNARAPEPAPAAAPKNWQFSDRGAVIPAGSSGLDDCARARNNVAVTSDWMRQGGTVYEKGSGKTLSQNESFDAAARNRQFIEDNCRGR